MALTKIKTTWTPQRNYLEEWLEKLQPQQRALSFGLDWIKDQKPIYSFGDLFFNHQIFPRMFPKNTIPSNKFIILMVAFFSQNTKLVIANFQPPMGDFIINKVTY